MVDLEALINMADVERAARKRLPRPIFDSIAGGAGDESTVSGNRAGLARWRLQPRSTVEEYDRELSTTVLGEPISFPVLLAPVGFQRMTNRDAELATARAAGAAGTGFLLSTATSYPLEAVAEVARGPRWFQLYMPWELGDAEVLIDRAASAGYTALCVTVDTRMMGLRERDIRNRMTMPFKLRPRTVLACAARPRWAMEFLRGGVGRGFGAGHGPQPMSIAEAGQAISRTKRTVTVSDLEWIRRKWDGPLIVKGVLRADECKRLLSVGVDGLVVSNHGGRQLDSVVATIDALPEIVDAVDGRAQVFVDGGFRRGTDVAKALALGARAVLVGRPFLYGLAVAGEEGVSRVLEIYRHELDTAMGLLGCFKVSDIDHSYVRWAPY